MFIVITKIDIAPKNVYEKTLTTLQKLLKHPTARKEAVLVSDDEDLDMLALA